MDGVDGWVVRVCHVNWRRVWAVIPFSYGYFDPLNRSINPPNPPCELQAAELKKREQDRYFERRLAKERKVRCSAQQWVVLRGCMGGMGGCLPCFCILPCLSYFQPSTTYGAITGHTGGGRAVQGQGGVRNERLQEEAHGDEEVGGHRQVRPSRTIVPCFG